ncbi:MAG: hypothetical protein HFI64_11525 [Lachnospiraceae bacterium]|nr:hypothetical protein [Lachnospiraceae bacterium]
MKIYIAFTRVGNMHVEVIQPEYGPNPYGDFLRERGPGIHHVKESVYAGDEALYAWIGELKDKGHALSYEGRYMEDIYYYVDTYGELGAHYEVGNSAAVSGHPRLVGHYPEET